MPTDVALLAEVPFFALLDDRERALLAERLDHVSLPAGRMVFSAGDPGGSLYVLRSGEVEVFVKNDMGDRILLETARAGDFFGEISMLDQGPRTASVLVTQDMDALVVDREDLDRFLRTRPEAAFDLLAAAGRRLRANANLLRRTISRNVNEAIEDKRTSGERIADWIAIASGSIPFLLIHCVLFSAWILLNVGLFHFGDFDPYPFGLLTMVVSLEAIILSVFVLLSQNRQAARDRVQRDIEYQVNLKAELEINHMHEKVDHMHSEILARMANFERAQSSK
jgi:uncharacterized membrane protein